MSEKIRCLRTSPIEENALLANAKTWHLSANALPMMHTYDGLLELIDDDAVLIPFQCRRLDPIHCLATLEPYQPKVILQHTIADANDGISAMNAMEPLLHWSRSGGRAEKLIRLAVFFQMMFEPDRRETKEYDYSLKLDWNEKVPFKRQLGLGFYDANSLVAQDLVSRSEWLRKGLQTLGFADEIVPKIEADKLTFETKEPWEARSRSTDNTPQKNGLDVWITPISSFDWLLTSTRGYFESVNAESLHSATVRIEVSTRMYNEMLLDVPDGFEGWDIQAFGCPSPATREWFAGDLSARPSGRIPLGNGWYGDENEGCSFDVSVVDTTHGPCIEFGSNSARSYDQLQECAIIFDNLEFHAVD